MSRKLIEEGTQAWNSISQNKNHVQWESVVFEIEEQFMRIARCSSRSLTQQVFPSSLAKINPSRSFQLQNDLFCCGSLSLHLIYTGLWMNFQHNVMLESFP